jgi:hypothetical protein
MYQVGIDPQITLLAICIETKVGEVYEKIAWFQVLLKRKDSWIRVEDWERYMVQQCIRTVEEIDGIIQEHVKYGVGVDVKFGVEQQRGRVKSIPETCLVTAAKKKGWKIHIPHPSRWKKAIGFDKVKTEGKDGVTANQVTLVGNKQNKKRAEELYAKELAVYCKEKKVPVPKVIHHLCDAACIALYLRSAEEPVSS